MSTSAARVPPSLEHLREKRDQLVARLALLTASRPARLARLDPLTSRAIARLPTQPNNTRTNERLDRTLPGPSGLDDAAERARRFRLTGRSVFGIELARGQRAKATAQENVLNESKGKGKARVVVDDEQGDQAEPEFVRKGVVVRLETFWRGRFFEPFYVVFDRVRATNDDEPAPSDGRLQLVHHTIPPFVPLRSLSSKYLGVSIRGQTTLHDDPDSSQPRQHGSGAKEPDLDLFLTHLQTYLDAYIARRQALDLVRAHYARAAHAALRFAVFASVSADRVTVEWDLPELGDDEAGDKEEDEDGPVAVSRQVVLQIELDALIRYWVDYTTQSEWTASAQDD